MSRILGISCYYHDAAACLVEDGVIVAAAQEERFTRKKFDAGFPAQAIRYCMAEAGAGQVDAVAFYDKPLLKFHRILETQLGVAPRGLKMLHRSLPLWLRERLWIQPDIEGQLDALGVELKGKLYFLEHHESHAASAFFPSPFADAAILTLDGVGEWTTTALAVGEGNRIERRWELRFPHSLGLLYSAFTYYAGFRVNSGEYKLMGLAPYGTPRYADRIRDQLIDLKADGSFRLNTDYFGYLDDEVMVTERFCDLFGGPPRKPEAPLTARDMDVASSIQQVTEEVVLRMARHARELTGKRSLCMSGGVALNCVANGKLLREDVFEKLWVQPAAGDSGSALGAALFVHHQIHGAPRVPAADRDGMRGALLGPSFDAEQIREYLDARGYRYREVTEDRWADEVAQLIAGEKVVALFQGRMEFGPRALGNRSIVGDPRSPRLQSVMNLKTKFRESFRPFAPACLEERASELFELNAASPYMLLVAPVREELRTPATEDARELDVTARVNQVRSTLPAITHVDYTARVQTVSRSENPRFHSLLKAFESLTGCPALINTSFNVRGEPIVCTPEDACRCFLHSGIDHLVLGPFILDKPCQPPLRPEDELRRELD